MRVKAQSHQQYYFFAYFYLGSSLSILTDSSPDLGVLGPAGEPAYIILIYFYFQVEWQNDPKIFAGRPWT